MKLSVLLSAGLVVAAVSTAVAGPHERPVESDRRRGATALPVVTPALPESDLGANADAPLEGGSVTPFRSFAASPDDPEARKTRREDDATEYLRMAGLVAEDGAPGEVHSPAAPKPRVPGSEGNAQDDGAILVPLPPTAMAGLLLLLGMGYARRRRR